jgi:hypothetical protein
MTTWRAMIPAALHGVRLPVRSREELRQDLVLPVRRLADDGLKAWQQVVERGV